MIGDSGEATCHKTELMLEQNCSPHGQEMKGRKIKGLRPRYPLKDVSSDWKTSHKTPPLKASVTSQ
jgi:hypothetical protein